MSRQEAFRGRFAFGTVLVLIALLMAAVVMWQPNSANAAGTTLYDFEECAQGWTVTENLTDPTTVTTWDRSQPGAPADPQGTAFRSAPYPIGLEAPDEIYIASVTSPTHPHPGGPVKVTYYVAYDLESTYDYMFFEWSVDGETWTEEEKWTGLNDDYPTFTLLETTFTAPAGPLAVRFRLMSDQNTQGNAIEGNIAFDEVTVPFDPPASAACGAAAPSASETGTAEPSGSASPTASSSPSPGPTDAPKKCTMSGTRKADTLRGTNRSDVICGRGGADKILGRGGKDTLRGQRGRDRLNGGGGIDACFGGPGSDEFTSCEEQRQ